MGLQGKQVLGKLQGSLRGGLLRYVIVCCPHRCVLTHSFSFFLFQNLEKDDEVFARYKQGMEFYPARIVKAQRGGKYRVRYHRDGKEEVLESMYIRRNTAAGMVCCIALDCHIPSFPPKVT